jgi:hypothetical protein
MYMYTSLDEEIRSLRQVPVGVGNLKPGEMTNSSIRPSDGRSDRVKSLLLSAWTSVNIRSVAHPQRGDVLSTPSFHPLDVQILAHTEIHQSR